MRRPTATQPDSRPGAIVGRDAELRAIERFLELEPEAAAGLVIEGEAGIGKTALWLEAVRTADARGYRVLEARPAESEAQLPYAALADLVSGVFEETRALLPQPQQRALAAALLQTEEEEIVDARTIATAVLGTLTALAHEQPVLVAVDDVQWLDSSSERALAFVLRRSPPRLRVLLTHRAEGGSGSPLDLDRVFNDGRLGRVSPEPLSVGALHHVIARRLGTAPARPTLARIATASGGNPFFALELARAIARESGARTPGDPLPVPPSLHELVAARLRGLSSNAQEAVLTAAALSRPTVVTVAQAVAPTFDASRGLEEAEDAAVLVSTRGRLRFTHPLLASVVYGSASDKRRRELHRRLADVVSDPEERALHRAQCTFEPDEQTADELEHAARRAADRGAQDSAAELFEAACRLTPVDRPDELARRFLGGAIALNAVGEFEDARDLTTRALAATRAPALRAQAFGLLGALAWSSGDAVTAMRRVDQALAEAGGDDALLGPIYAKAVRFAFSFDFSRALGYARAASELLSAEREPLLLGHVLVDRVWAGALCGLGAEGALLERALQLEAEGLPGPRADPQAVVLLWFHSIDDFDAARARYAMEEQWYRERGAEVSGADRRSHIALAELRAGNWDEAERHVEASCAAVEKLDVRGPLAMVFEKRSLVDAHRGRIERARATLVPMIERYELAGQAWWAALSLSTLAFLEFTAGDDAGADRALVRMRELASSVGAKDVLLDRSEPFHVEALLALGDLDRAREELTRLEERGRTLPRPWITAALPRTRALVLAAEGDVGAALAAFAELDLATSAHLPFELGWTLLVKGRLLRRAKQKRAAAESLREALDIFEHLGAPTWADRARSELDRVGLRHRSPHELTASERRVAELAAGGLTNRQVAAAAFMSPKTVEANLSRVYRKLGISSRAELGARIAAEQREAETQT